MCSHFGYSFPFSPLSASASSSLSFGGISWARRRDLDLMLPVVLSFLSPIWLVYCTLYSLTPCSILITKVVRLSLLCTINVVDYPCHIRIPAPVSFKLTVSILVNVIPWR